MLLAGVVLWAAITGVSPAEAQSACMLTGSTCDCPYKATVAGLSRSWGKPVGHGNERIVAKFTTQLQAELDKPENRNSMSNFFASVGGGRENLRTDADSITTFQRGKRGSSVSVLGKNQCAVQIVLITPTDVLIKDPVAYFMMGGH